MACDGYCEIGASAKFETIRNIWPGGQVRRGAPGVPNAEMEECEASTSGTMGKRRKGGKGRRAQKRMPLGDKQEKATLNVSTLKGRGATPASNDSKKGKYPSRTGH